MSNPEDEIKNSEDAENAESADSQDPALNTERNEPLEASQSGDLDGEQGTGPDGESDPAIVAESIEGSEQASEADAQDQTLDSEDYERFSQVLKNAKEISGRLEVLVPGVLDTADATNSAADVSRRASSALENGLDHLQKRVNELVEASSKGAALSTRILLGAVVSLLIAVGLIGFISVELSARVNQVDEMMVALSKRVVKMNSALQTFEQINFSINQLATKQAQFADNQMLLAEAVTKAEQATVSLNKQVPAATAKSVSAETGKFAKQIDKLNIALIAQGKKVELVSGSVKKLEAQLKSFDGSMANVAKLNADVGALITLEREKYLEALQRQTELQKMALATEQPEEEIDSSIVVYPYVSNRR